MNSKAKIFLLLIPLMCSACSSRVLTIKPINEVSTELPSAELPGQFAVSAVDPERAMVDFFTYLNQGDYAQASELYGGSYDILQDYNPDLNLDDKTALLKAGCEQNGLMCLAVEEVLSVQTNDQTNFLFEVQFTNRDGSLFILGPCCGADEETMPPVSTFLVGVRCQEGGPCLVMDLPPSVP